MKRLIDTSAFRRLSHISQLGLVTLVSGALGFSASACFGPGSLIRLLENISRCLYEGHRVDCVATDPDLIVKMRAGRTS